MWRNLSRPRPRASCWSASSPARYAVPTCTSARATCRCTASTSRLVTRSWARSLRSAARSPATPQATGSAAPGCRIPTARASTAAAATRTSARTRSTPAGTPTAGTRSTRRSRRPLRTGCPHLCAQVALAEGATVHVLTRGAAAQRLALELGAASVGGAYDQPPEPLDGAILFAPVGDLVPVAMRALDRGGVLSVAGIHLSDIPPLNYERELFYEKELRSVTSNTRRDGREFLDRAARYHVRATTHVYPMDQAQQALQDLKAGRFDGAAVLVNDSATAP